MTANTISDAMTMAGGEGTLLANRYRIVRQLGQGGMGSVWLAEDTQLDNKQFAIKMLPSVLVSNKRAYNQLKSEALVAMRLVHPNIVQIRAFEENNGNPFLVMDYIDGQTLDDYLAEKGKLNEDETIRFLRPIAVALDYAHGEGVVHRDVKPANVMIRKDGHPYILDFGIAREIQETMTRVTGKLSSGTLLYMSPEQLHGAAPKKEQDIYSFAAMVYECLSGNPPFSRGQIEYQIDNDMPEPLDPHIIISAHVAKGLAKSPEDRPSNCAAVLDGNGSRRFAEPQRGVGGQQASSTCCSPVHGGAWKIVAALVTIAIVVLGGSVWYKKGQRRESERKQEVAIVNSPESVALETQTAISNFNLQVEILRKEINGKIAEEVAPFRAQQGGFADIVTTINKGNKSLKNLPEPRTVEEAESFLGNASNIVKAIEYGIELLHTQRVYRINQLLADARNVLDPSSLDKCDLCISNCAEVLELDPNNDKAMKLKIEAESRLVPTVRVIVKVDGREVKGAKFTFGGKTYTDLRWGKLTAGSMLLGGDACVEYTENDKRYIGKLNDCSVNWRGSTNIVVVLEEHIDPTTVAYWKDVVPTKDGFLGLKFGEKLKGMNFVSDNEEPTLLRAKFTPPKMLAGFEDYYVYVTPKTHKVVKVYACAKEAVDPITNWRSHYIINALEKCYDTWAHPMSWNRPIYRFDIGSERFVTVCLVEASRDYETVIVAWDNALLTTASEETEELHKAAGWKCEECKDSRFWPAAAIYCGKCGAKRYTSK